MKATGIIRRIDDLGRVVIPKEIRNNLRINAGDNLEIYVSNEDVVLRKFSVMTNTDMVASYIAESAYFVTGNNILISNFDTYISAFGPLKKKCLNQKISYFFSSQKEKRREYVMKNFESIEIIKDVLEQGFYAFSPIIVSSDAVGFALMVSEKEIKEDDFFVLKTISRFLGKYIEQ